MIYVEWRRRQHTRYNPVCLLLHAFEALKVGRRKRKTEHINQLTVAAIIKRAALFWASQTAAELCSGISRTPRKVSN